MNDKGLMNYLEEDTREFLKEQVREFVAKLMGDENNEYIVKNVLSDKEEIADNLFTEIICSGIPIKGKFTFDEVINDMTTYIEEGLSVFHNKNIVISLDKKV